jgi:phytoene desaturase
MHKTGIVIGAGIAGLAAAARLAASGADITVFEKNKLPGGKLGQIRLGDYTFDTGPSLFTQPYLFEELFTYCGKDLSDYLDYEPLHVNNSYFFEDGINLICYKDHSALAEEMREKFGTDARDLLHHLHRMDTLYRSIGTIFLNEPIHKWSTWTSPAILKALGHLKWRYLVQSMHGYHKHALKNPKLVQLFDRFATYNGSNPYKAPAMLSMIAHLEMNEGSYYSRGGMISLAKAVYKLCKDLGVNFRFDSGVDSILSTNGQVQGVVANGESHSADLIVSNSDVYYTYKNLLKDDRCAGKVKQQERSSSAVIFYWGIEHQFPELHLHNIFFSADYQKEFAQVFDRKQPPGDPTIYINITSKMENSHAPGGCENWFILVNVPAGLETDAAQIKEIRQRVIGKLSRMLKTSIEPLITVESVLTPEMLDRRDNSYLGALYGTASNTPLAAFSRHSNQSSVYKNLYFVGGTVHPGGGIPLCLRSAKIAAGLIRQNHLKA